MQAIVSTLPEPFYNQVQSLWQQLDLNCQLKGVCITPYPHITWHVGEYTPRTLDILNDLIQTLAPIPIQTTGLGIFTGEKPVLYIPVVKTIELIKLHSQIWDAIAATATHNVEIYHSKTWVPHITLAYNDLTPENIDSAVKLLAFQSFDWDFSLTNLALIKETIDGELYGSIEVFDFKTASC
ncbi:MAG: 2'-5' RNA ligase family protein [Anaerolineaceae bacterium]|nr:2'-5' RNA ligase family protein [Anaerolineaceae bacterium]